MKSFFAFFLLLGAAVTATPLPMSYPTPGFLAPTGSPVFATGGPLIAYYLDSVSGNGSRLWVNGHGPALPSQPMLGSPAAGAGDSFYFGSYLLGTSLGLSLEVSTHGSWSQNSTFTPSYVLYSGPGVGNSDGLVHAWIALWPGAPNSLFVGFEDMLNGGDMDYNDYQFVLSGAATTRPQNPSLAAMLPMIEANESIPVALIGVGLFFMGLIRARRGPFAMG